MNRSRQHLDIEEIRQVLSHYRLGTLRRARELVRGSRQAPKTVIETDRGRFLLKRRAPGRDRTDRILLAHALMNHLRTQGLPVPRPITPADGNEPFVRIDGRTYEVFEYIEGEHYDGSLEQTMQAGRTLARFHVAAAGLRADPRLRRGGYHDSQTVRGGLNAVPTRIASHDSVVGREAELLGIVQELFERYDEAAEEVNRLGGPGWPSGIVHGDWHPGNLLFRGQRVRAVLDFDAVRVAPVVLDVANGMLQFSILRGGDEPETWPEYFDLTRMRRFYLGYRSRRMLTPQQRRALVPLMLESLIAESVVPIAATGSFGDIPGFGVLQTVRRKVRWLLRNADAIRAWAEA